MHGKTAGVIGTGGNRRRRAAAILKGFGMRLLAFWSIQRARRSRRP